MARDFRNQLALVTGGSSGIGLATARAFAQAGARVWILARNPHRLSQALEIIQSASTHATKQCGMIAADVADENQVELEMSRFIASEGVPDILINSAGVAHPGFFAETDACIFQEMMSINYLGTVFPTKAVLPGMVQRGSGCIVNLASITSFVGVVGYSAYGASKYAIRGLSDVLRAEYKPKGIQVSIVYPPDVDTPQLAYENHFKPGETIALEQVVGATKPMTPEAVAEDILKGIRRGQYAILPGTDSKILYHLTMTVGSWIYPAMDFLLYIARKKSKRTVPPRFKNIQT